MNIYVPVLARISDVDGAVAVGLSMLLYQARIEVRLGFIGSTHPLRCN